MSDAINPKHYKHLPAEAIDIIEAAIAKAPSNKAACLHWQTLKYLLRCWEKNGVEDLRKGKVYFDRLVNQFDEPSKPPPDLSQMGVEVVSVFGKPKRYREPTLADLANGPIECEVRDCDIQAWWRATLHNIYADTPYRFRARKHDSVSEPRYAQCRIEVTQ